jgi:hypothetical protein
LYRLVRIGLIDPCQHLHGRLVTACHLHGEHGLCFIVRLNSIDGSEHRVELLLSWSATTMAAGNGGQPTDRVVRERRGRRSEGIEFAKMVALGSPKSGPILRTAWEFGSTFTPILGRLALFRSIARSIALLWGRGRVSTS